MEEGRNEVTFDVTLETEWRWRGEAFSPVEGIRQVMEEPGKGQRLLDCPLYSINSEFWKQCFKSL